VAAGAALAQFFRKEIEDSLVVQSGEIGVNPKLSGDADTCAKGEMECRGEGW
jgi:hypothetical protein